MRPNRNRFYSVVVTISGLAMLALTAGVTHAQETGVTSKGQTADPALLAGPDVEDEATDAADDRMTAVRHQNDHRRNRPSIPPRMWIRELRGSDLTDDQRVSMNAIIKEFETKQRAYVQEYGKELREITSQFRKGRLDKVQVSPELRERIDELRALSPQFKDYQQRIWNDLDDDQRAELTTRLEVLQKKISEERENRRSRFDKRSDKQRDKQQRRRSDSIKAGADHSGQDGFDELGQRRLRFLMRHKKAGARGQGDHDVRRERRLPPPPAPVAPPSGE